jgi:hypothetical protein
MDKKITRREAIKGMFFAGVGLAASGSLLQSCASRNAKAATASDVKAIPWTEAPEGSKVDTKTWPKLGETLSRLGLGCMRLPTVAGATAGGYGRRASLDQKAVNEMVDYAIAHGVNYFDTAPAYGESEVVMGKALSRYPRESYKLATKMSNQNGLPTLDAAKQMFETSLKNLQVDFFDFFLLHNVAGVDVFNRRFRDNGVFDYILEQKAAGRIKHLGFSFHGTNATLAPMLDLYDWDFVQIQLNYADWKDMPAGFGAIEGDTSSEYLYNLLTERGIPVLVMEPIKGGALANVSDAIAGVLKERHPDLTPAGNALTFVGSLPNVLVTLSGMSNLEQLKENVSTFTDFKPFDDKEMAFMQTVADLYKSNIHIPCTGCSYCMPCPQGVNIPGNFRAFNTASDQLSIPDPDNRDRDKDYDKRKKTFLKLYDQLEKGEKASACITCNACLSKCPQRIRIPEQLKMINDLVAKL